MAVDANNIITTVGSLGSAVFGWLGQKEQAKAAQSGAAGSQGTYLLLGGGLLLLVTVIALKKS
jgi:hypothetical protein